MCANGTSRQKSLELQMIRSLTLAIMLASVAALPALAQDMSGKAPSAAQAVAPLVITAEQAKVWIGKPVYSSDNKKIGEIAAFARGTDNTVTEMHADIGGFLGLGETRVRLTPNQFKLDKDHVNINLTAVQAKELPKVVK
jgi:hypothetical protein